MQSSVERSCPGENVTFTCTISSLAHQWNIPSRGIIQSLLPNDQGNVMSNPPFQFAVTEVMTGTSITSTATVTATADLNGTTVLCQDGIGMLQDQSSTIMTVGKHLVLCLHTNGIEVGPVWYIIIAVHVNLRLSICLALIPGLCPVLHHLQYFTVATSSDGKLAWE